jgi:hypothetical protein
MLLNLGLWLLGAVFIVAGVIALRRPLARYRELQAVDANAQRYDAWRGGSRTAAGTGVGGRTGADVMRQHWRSEIQRAALYVVIGIVLVIAGFAVR